MPKPSTARVELERFLIAPSSFLPQHNYLRAARLEAFAYAQLSKKQPERVALRPAFAAAAARHELVKQELIPLLRLWSEAGLEVLLFKGFYLAEFIYDNAAQRFYGDVDVLVHEEDLAKLMTLAKSLGWQGKSVDSVYSHELFYLSSPQGHVRLDAQRYPIKLHSYRNALHKHVATEVWLAAQPFELDGVQVLTMQGIDSLLVGLIVNRSWGDHWGVKPHDYLDFKQLLLCYKLTEKQLRARAKSLNLTRTLSLFLKRCNPFEQTLKLYLPPWLEQQKNSFFIIPERGYWNLDRRLLQLSRGPETLLDMLICLPRVIYIYRLLEHRKDVAGLLASFEKRQKKSILPLKRFLRGLRWAIKLIPNRDKRILIRTLALFSELRARGENAVFVQGHKNEKSILKNYSWLELDGQPFLGFGDENVRRNYEVNFEYAVKH